MAEISEVPGITGSTLELFKSVGLQTAESLVARTVGEILGELDLANSRNVVPVRRPSAESVRTWKHAAWVVAGKPAAGGGSALPAAKAVPEKILRAAGIDVTSVPIAKVVEEPPAAARDDRKPAESAAPKSEPAQEGAGPLRGQANTERAAKPVKRKTERPKTAVPPNAKTVANEMMAARGTTHQSRPPGGAKSARHGDANADQRPAQTAGQQPVGSSPEKEPELEIDPNTNRFRQVQAVQEAKPQGERRNRGMSHPDAVRVRLAATVTILSLAACVFAVVVVIAALVMTRFYDWQFHWTIALLLLVFPISLFAYLSIGAKVRCRLCGQKLFIPRHCLKHERANSSIFGHTFAVARDAMLFGSYRCMLCGTKTRLRN